MKLPSGECHNTHASLMLSWSTLVQHSLLFTRTSCWTNCQVADDFDAMTHLSYHYNYRADCRVASNQWETLLQSNAISHWLGANLELALNQLSSTAFIFSKQWYPMSILPGGRFKNIHELLNLRALKFSPVYEWDILRGISKVPFEIPHKISDPYIEKYDFNTTSKF